MSKRIISYSIEYEINDENEEDCFFIKDRFKLHHVLNKIFVS